MNYSERAKGRQSRRLLDQVGAGTVRVSGLVDQSADLTWIEEYGKCLPGCLSKYISRDVDFAVD